MLLARQRHAPADSLPLAIAAPSAGSRLRSNDCLAMTAAAAAAVVVVVEAAADVLDAAALPAGGPRLLGTLVLFLFL